MDVTVERTIERPVAVVSSYVCDLPNAVHWMSKVSAARWDDGSEAKAGAKVVFSTFASKDVEDWVWEVVDFAQGEKLVMKTASGPFPQQVTWTWVAAGSGTTMSMQITGKPSAKDRLRSPLMGRELQTSMTEDLGALKGMLEGHPVG